MRQHREHGVEQVNGLGHERAQVVVQSAQRARVSVESAEQKENVWKPKRQQRYELMKKLGGKSVVSGVLPRNRLKMSACEPKKSDANGKKMNALREKKRSDV